MRIIAAQLNQTIGDFEGNTARIIQALEKGRAQKADIVLFSELAICGYPPEDLLLHHAFVEEMQRSLEEVAKASKGLMAVVGFARPNNCVGEKPLFNSAAIIQDGKIAGYYDKWLLPTYDVFDERRYFEPGSSLSLWEWKGKKIAIIICEDIWKHAGVVEYKRDPINELASSKIDVLLNLSSSPYQFQKPETRVSVCAKSAQALKCPVVLCCQVGGNDQLIFDGYSAYIDKDGKLRQLAKGFQEDLLLIDLDAPACPCPFHYDPLQDLYKALVLGVRDYFHKSGFFKGCLGLSGGIDSALVACIAVEALGKENVLGISMPSRYSSSSSIEDAQLLVQRLGIAFQKISIEGPFQDYLDLLQPSFMGKGPDVTEENLQSRIRGMILMALSNKLDYVVLSTGNKSELALGYCTLYGDMCGGLNVIGDVTKTQVYALARFVNRYQEIIPLSTIEKPPSAELRPDQKDSDTLPPYEIIDSVLKLYVEECLSAEEIAQKGKFPLNLVLDLIHKIHKAEYKRRQAAPGIRVSKKAFRVGRRYPIVQKWK